MIYSNRKYILSLLQITLMYVAISSQRKSRSICAKGESHLLLIYYKRKNFTENGSALGWSIVHYNRLRENRVWFAMYNRIQTIAIQKLVNFYSFLRCHY